MSWCGPGATSPTGIDFTKTSETQLQETNYVINNRPRKLEDAGVTLVNDATPYELTKLCLLNA